MKKYISFIIFSAITLLFVNCDFEKEFNYNQNPVAVETIDYQNINPVSTKVTGKLNSDQGNPIQQKGICYSLNENPTIQDLKVLSPDTNNGLFEIIITNLLPNTVYYVRAFATNNIGTAYGSSIKITTNPASLPTVATTTSITSISYNSAVSGGSISNDGYTFITSKGVCWSNTNTMPTISNSKTVNGTGTSSFTSSLTSLLSGTIYYVRAYATNSVGTSYGPVRTFTTLTATIPTGITTISASSINQTTATSGGSITSNGGSAITQKGICWSSTISIPTISNSNTNNGTGSTSYSSALTGLVANTTYYVRAYAINGIGIGYGNTITFTTLPNLIVGQAYQGGIIAHIFVTGESGYVSGQVHGLIATTSNQSTGAQWGCSGTSIAGTSTTLGSGLSNTTAIVGGCTTSTIAAAICNNLTSGGYSDWYLPSREELNKLYLNRSVIGGFSGVPYWSSSQNNSTTANSINFNTGIVTSTSTKTTAMYVRAIRKF